MGSINKASVLLSQNKETEVVATVEKRLWVKNYSSSYSVKINYADGEKCNCGAKLVCPFEIELDIGESISFVPDETEATEFNDLYSVSDGYLFSFTVNSRDSLSVSGDGQSIGVFAFLTNFANRLSNIIRISVGGEEGKLCSSMLFGTSEMSDYVKRDFRRSGVSHVLAVSGMHMSVIVAVFSLILKKLKLGETARILILIVLIFTYMAMLGFSASSLRSGIMLIITLLCRLFGTDNDGLSTLSLSVTIILAANPLSVFDCGFILSVCATFGIIILNPLVSSFPERMKRNFKRKKQTLMAPARRLMIEEKAHLFLAQKCMPVLTVIISANIMTIVPVSVFFGEVSLMSPVSNLFFPFLSEGCLVLSLVVLMTPSGCFLHGMAAFYAKKLASAMIASAQYFSDIRGVSVSLNYKTVSVILWMALILTLLLFSLKLRHRLLCLLPFTVALSALCVFYVFFVPYSVDVLVNEQGSSENVVCVSHGSAVIIDISSGNYNDIYEMTEKADVLGATEIECLIMTHYHVGHSGSAEKIMSTRKVRSIYLPAPVTVADAAVFLNVADIAQNLGVSCFIYDDTGEITVFGNMTLTLSGPDRIKRSTHPTGYVEIECGIEKLLLLGQSFCEAEGLTEGLQVTGDSNVMLLSHGPKAKTVSQFDLRNAKQIAVFDTGILSSSLGAGVSSDYYGKVFQYEKTACFRFENRRRD